MGTRLKIANIRLIITIISVIDSTGVDKEVIPKRIIKPKIIAITIFTAGPAKATIASPHFLLRRLYGLNGTGFAQPNNIGE